MKIVRAEKLYLTMFRKEGTYCIIGPMRYLLVAGGGGLSVIELSNGNSLRWLDMSPEMDEVEDYIEQEVNLRRYYVDGNRIINALKVPSKFIILQHKTLTTLTAII